MERVSELQEVSYACQENLIWRLRIGGEEASGGLSLAGALTPVAPCWQLPTDTVLVNWKRPEFPNNELK